MCIRDRFRTALGGRLLQLELGKVCEQANGQVTVRYGDTVVNCTATASKQPRQDIDFFPLSCDYEEKMYSVGTVSYTHLFLTLESSVVHTSSRVRLREMHRFVS